MTNSEISDWEDKNDTEEFKTFEELLEAAEKGDIDAQWDLVFMYENGKDVPRDYNMAAYWVKRAAILGNAEAQMRLGALYEIGEGVERNTKKAIKWYVKAKSLFEERAAEGDASAMYYLGMVYQHGTGVMQDMNKALKWFRLAASYGFDLGSYDEGASDVDESNSSEEVERLEEAANNGDTCAMGYLALKYMTGDGVPYDRKKAKELLIKSAEMGNKAARESLLQILSGFGKL